MTKLHNVLHSSWFIVCVVVLLVAVGTYSFLEARHEQADMRKSQACTVVLTNAEKQTELQFLRSTIRTSTKLAALQARGVAPTNPVYLHVRHQEEAELTNYLHTLTPVENCP